MTTTKPARATKTIKTSDLIGPALDWAVAKCEGLVARFTADKEGVIVTDTGRPVPYQHKDYSPSQRWAEGGPIIERERIEVRPGEKIVGWFGSIQHVYLFMEGTTALAAAMRCYVFSKVGDTVDIPEELVS